MNKIHGGIVEELSCRPPPAARRHPPAAYISRLLSGAETPYMDAGLYYLQKHWWRSGNASIISLLIIIFEASAEVPSSILGQCTPFCSFNIIYSIFYGAKCAPNTSARELLVLRPHSS